MVKRCVKCNRIISNYNIYCPKCEQEVKKKIEKEDKYKKKLNNADFFEKQKIKK